MLAGRWWRTALSLTAVGILVYVGLLISNFVCFVYGVSAPAYPGQPVRTWIEHLWSFTARWMWWWVGAALVLGLSGVVSMLLPRRK